MVSSEFLIDTILPAPLWPWGRLGLWQKWVPGIFSGGKGGRCVGPTTLPPSCATVLKSRSLNLLEPSGPVQVCNGDCFTFTFYLSYSWNLPRFVEPEGFFYHVYKCHPVAPNPSQINPVDIFPTYLFQIYFNIIPPSTSASLKWSLSFRFPHQFPALTSLPMRPTCPSHLFVVWSPV